jgi:hypothetical protein
MDEAGFRGAETEPRKHPVLRALRVAAAIAGGALLFYLAMRGVAWSEAWRVMREMRWPAFSLALTLVAISPFVRAWRWRELYEGSAPGFWLLMRAVAAGQTLNFVLPFRSGEVARVVMVEGRRLESAGTIAFEKLLDAAFFATLCVLLPFVWVVPQWLEAPRESVTIMALGYLTVVILLALVAPRISRLPRIVHIPPLNKVPLLAGTTLFLGLSGVLVNNWVLKALQIQVPFMAAVVLLVILQVGVAVPSTPGKLGVFQYLAVLGLSLFKVEHAPALAFGLVLHLLVFLPTAIMAGLFWLLGRSPAGRPLPTAN